MLGQDRRGWVGVQLSGRRTRGVKTLRPTSRSSMHRAAIDRRFVPLVHAAVADDAGDAEAVVGEDVGSAEGLGGAVRFPLPPFGEGGLVAPEGEREDLAGSG